MDRLLSSISSTKWPTLGPSASRTMRQGCSKGPSLAAASDNDGVPNAPLSPLATAAATNSRRRHQLNVVYIEGTIGCGKSTLMNNIALALGGGTVCAQYQEPIANWTQLLQAFYKDQARHAFALQMRVLHSFLSRPRSVPCESHASAPILHLVERSPAACRHVFGRLLLESGKLSAEESRLFDDYHDTLFGEATAKQAAIFIHCDPLTSVARKDTRMRADDRDIGDDYMSDLHRAYSRFVCVNDLEELKTQGVSYATSDYFAKVVAVDGTRSVADVARLALKAVNMLFDDL